MPKPGSKIRLPKAALATLRAGDAELGAALDRVGPVDLRRGSYGELEALVRAIAGQQLSGKAAATIFGRFVGLFDLEPETSFPTPRAILATHHARLRKAGLSRQKQAAIKDLCRHVLSGELPLSGLATLDDEAVITLLTRVRGIGRWSAQMFLIFQLGRLNVWPIDDLGVRKGFAKLRGWDEPPTARELDALGQAYQPYRSIVAWCCWRLLDGPAVL